MKKILFTLIIFCALLNVNAQTDSETKTETSFEAVVDAYKSYGIEENVVSKMRTFLVKKEIKEELVNYVLVISPKIFTSFTPDATDQKLPEWAVKKFTELGINADQQEAIKNINLRLAQMASNNNG